MSAKLSDFYANLDAFANARQLEWSQGKSESAAILEMEGFPIKLLYMEERDLLFIQSAVGIPPEEPKQKAALWKRLLKANNAFAETSGATLGYDEEMDVITLQLSWPLDGLNRQSFENLLENVISLLVQWVQELSQNEVSASNVDDDSRETLLVPDSMAHLYMLRI